MITAIEKYPCFLKKVNKRFNKGWPISLSNSTFFEKYEIATFLALYMCTLFFSKPKFIYTFFGKVDLSQ
jgi:hypothetical protein